jgi:hypothetical protein
MNPNMKATDKAITVKRPQKYVLTCRSFAPPFEPNITHGIRPFVQTRLED